MKIFEVICFYIVLASVLFTAALVMPWALIGVFTICLLIGVSKAVKQAVLVVEKLIK